MTYDKTWTFQVNTVPTDQTSDLNRIKSWGYQLKTFLVSVAGWTVAASSDGTSSGSSDYWSGISSLIFANEGTAHSWVVLKSPAGIVAGSDGSYTGDQSRLWFCIFCGTNTSGSQQVKFSYHREAPTGGSTTATPTSTDKIIRSFFGFYQPNLSSHFHFACTSEGNFYALASGDTTGKFWQVIGILPLAAISQVNGSGHDYPYGAVILDSACWYQYDTLTGGYLGRLWLMPNSGYSGNLNAWCADGTWAPSVSGSDHYGNVRAMVLGNGDSTATNPGGWIGYSFPSGGDSVNSLQQYGQVHVQVETGGKTAYIGRLADVYGSGAGTPQLSVDNITTPTMQFFGNLWLPTNAVMSL